MSHLIHKTDKDDARDYAFAPSIEQPPATASLRAYCPTPYDQLKLKSCSANATSAALQLLANKSQTKIDPPSRLFLYYYARVNDGDVAGDNGATIRDALKAAAQPGVCPETDWPYDEANVLVKPPEGAYARATTRVAEYRRIPRSLAALKSCIAEGYPFLMGVQVYASVAHDSKTTGVMKPPQANDTLLGGHAVLAVGYDDSTSMFTVLNSLGPNFGDAGYLHIPYSYFETDKLTYDFWTIRKTG